jgi:hypothetical protein
MGLDITFVKIKRRDLGYFHKVNFLVGFFERHGMSRDFGRWWVEIELASELLDACQQVLEDHSKATELLPATEGFFYGSYEYNDQYFNDVLRVKEFCENTLIPQIESLDDDEAIEFNMSW